ncbi:Alpha/Beta hydrolase protein [Aspergillus leporis]|uniref:Alpha/Beta hydrolase protein n=1 Tax=Aspergillus leporis TaxID=41062 RepID=A0A5N5WPQ5_9EURO|nr:Alpha/Beta hydrolase protein [Aspergillus leporis]
MPPHTTTATAQQPSPLSPGTHTFPTTSTTTTITYTVQPAKSPIPSSTLIVIHPPSWGIGPQYLMTGLSPLSTHHTLLTIHPSPTATATGRTPQTCPLECLRHHLNLPSFPVLLAHSNGSAQTLLYAQIYPQKVQKLILLNHQLPGYQDRADLSDLRYTSDPRYASTIEKLASGTLKPDTDEGFTEWVDTMWPLYFFDPGRWVEVLRGDIGARIMRVREHEAVYGKGGWLERVGDGVLERLGDVSAETLIISGRGDLICGVGIGERTRIGIPGARLLVYEECGHFPWIEQRERTFKDIGEFVCGGNIAST